MVDPKKLDEALQKVSGLPLFAGLFSYWIDIECFFPGGTHNLLNYFLELN